MYRRKEKTRCERGAEQEKNKEKVGDRGEEKAHRQKDKE